LLQNEINKIKENGSTGSSFKFAFKIKDKYKKNRLISVDKIDNLIWGRNTIARVSKLCDKFICYLRITSNSKK